MQAPTMVERRDFVNAVNGWNQSVGILRKLRDGLQFTVNEINENKGSFSPSHEKAVQFEAARDALRTADAYLSAMDHEI